MDGVLVHLVEMIVKGCMMFLLARDSMGVKVVVDDRVSNRKDMKVLWLYSIHIALLPKLLNIE